MTIVQSALRWSVSRKRRQIVLLSPKDGGGMNALGTPAELRAKFANFNTGPDGGPNTSMGTEFFHGPGIAVELPSGQDVITQAIVSISDEDIAWPVLGRLCKSTGWKMMDMESGRVFGG